MKFLIVDDSKAMQTIVHKTLVSSGYSDHDYDYAFNGKEALDKIHASKPDVVLCDWHMPEMNGLELLHKIREEHINVKIGLVTTERYQERIKEARDAGALFVVSKPFNAETLCQAVEEAISAGAQQPDQVGSYPSVILPSPKSIKKTLASLTSHGISLEERDEFSVAAHQFPFVVCLYQDSATGHVVAVSVMDIYAACYLGSAVHNVPAKEVAIVIQNQMIPKDYFDSSKLFMELLASHITNEDDSMDVSCKGVHMVNASMERFRSLMQKKNRGSKCYSFGIEGHGAGKLFLLTQ